MTTHHERLQQLAALGLEDRAEHDSYRALCNHIDTAMISIRHYREDPEMGGGAADAALAKLDELLRALQQHKARLVGSYQIHDAARDVMRKARTEYEQMPYKDDLSSVAEKRLFAPQKGQQTFEDGNELARLEAWRAEQREERSRAILLNANAKLAEHALKLRDSKFDDELGEVGSHDPAPYRPRTRTDADGGGWTGGGSTLGGEAGNAPYPHGVKNTAGGGHTGGAGGAGAGVGLVPPIPGGTAGGPGNSGSRPGSGSGRDGELVAGDPGVILPGRPVPDGAIPIRLANGDIAHYVPPGINMNDPRWSNSYRIGGEHGATALAATTGVTGVAAAAAVARGQSASAAMTGMLGVGRGFGAAPAGGNLGAHLGGPGAGAGQSGMSSSTAAAAAGRRVGFPTPGTGTGAPGTSGTAAGGGGVGMMPAAGSGGGEDRERRRRKGYKAMQLEPEGPSDADERFRQMFGGMEPPKDPKLELLNARRRERGLEPLMSERYYVVMGLEVPEEVRELGKH